MHRLTSCLAALGFAALTVLVPVSAQAAGALPPGVQQALVYFNLYSENRHVRLIVQTLAGAHPEVGPLVNSPDAVHGLGLSKVASAAQFDRQSDYLISVKGSNYSAPKAKVKSLLQQFAQHLLARPDFEQLFDSYVARLNVAERVGIELQLLAKSKSELFGTDARKFILKIFKAHSRKRLKQAQGKPKGQEQDDTNR